MNIAIVTGIFPPDIGGPATFVPLVAQELSARHRVRGVITLGDGATGIRGGFSYPVISIRRSLPKLFRIPLTIWKIARLARQADVVLVAGLVFESILATRLLALRPTVVRVGGDKIWENACAAKVTSSSIEVFQYEKLSFKWRMLRKLQAMYTRRASVVVAPSAQLAEVVRRFWKVPASRVHVVPNAVVTAVKNDAGADRQPYQFDVITVCRLLPLKGLEPLVDVAITHGWRLAIIGDGPLRKSLEERVREGDPARKVRLLGRMASSEVRHTLQESKVFVLNSIGEGLPNSLLEAKANGLPVVATAVGGNTEVVRDGVDGFLIRSGDINELFTRVTELLTSESTRAAFGIAGQRDVAERYCIAQMMSSMERALAQAVERWSPSSD
jgi:glycosyltransferase involved in cell wall biosynthesis